jgi:hypothetical protein
VYGEFEGRTEGAQRSLNLGVYNREGKEFGHNAQKRTSLRLPYLASDEAF